MSELKLYDFKQREKNLKKLKKQELKKKKKEEKALAFFTPPLNVGY